MKRDSKLSGVLHILLHMAAAEGPLTSERLAGMLRTNPVFVRKILAGLREHGFVQSEKGHGGGWRFSCDLKAVTLYDIYVALDSPTILAIGNRTETTGCLVEESLNDAMSQAFQEAEAVLLARFRDVTLDELSDSVFHRARARKNLGDHNQVLSSCSEDSLEDHRV